jgi:SAM-dependent methyltransferase
MSAAFAEAAQPDATTAAALRNMIMGFRATQLVYVAAKLGLADHLQQGPQAPERLAQLVGAEPRALARLLRALASLGVFAETSAGAFATTPLARLLQTGSPGSLRGMAILYGENWLWQAYGQMLHSVQTSRPAFEHVHGQPFYEYLDRHPAAATQFQEAMSAFSDQEAAAILAAYDFSRPAVVIDVGGGHGALIAALLLAHPQLSGVVFDLPEVAAEAGRRLAAVGLAARARGVAGDMFAQIPADGDLYLLKSVLHNWDDAACVAILRACRRAMADDSRLLVIERIVPPGNSPAEAKLFDINMLVALGGQERTEREYRRLFEAAGFELTGIVATSSPLSLIEGLPVAPAGPA